jgi:membrane-associated phospholipid phosphatase
MKGRTARGGARSGHRALAFGLCVGLVAALGSRAAAADPAKPSPRLKEGQHFKIDPVVDGVLIVGGASFSILLAEILSTGEIQPTPPGSSDNLLAIDRVAVTQTVDPHAGTYSNIGLGVAIGYAIVDPIISGVRGGRNALLVDGVMYAESITITQALTQAVKIAVRRPRPIDYVQCGPTAAPGDCTATDLQLSFFSAHAAVTGAISATATYLAFMRAPHSARAWVTLGAGIALTAFVSYERVRSGEHFPTDVIMGSMAGAAIGVLVPHLHRHEAEAPPVWIGFAPAPDRAAGGELVLGARF